MLQDDQCALLGLVDACLGIISVVAEPGAWARRCIRTIGALECIIDAFYGIIVHLQGLYLYREHFKDDLVDN